MKKSILAALAFFACLTGLGLCASAPSAPKEISPSFVLKDTRAGTNPYLYDVNGDGVPDYVFSRVQHGPFEAQMAIDNMIITTGGGPANASTDYRFAAAYSGKTGARLWQYDAGLAILSDDLDKKNGLLYLSGETGHVAAVDLHTGQEVWCSLPRQGNILDMIVAPKVIYAASTEDSLYCLDKLTGSILWAAHQKSTVSPLFDQAWPYLSLCRGVLVSATREHFLYGYDGRTGKLKWDLPIGGEPLLIRQSDTFVYVWNAESLSAVDPLTGRVAWTNKAFNSNTRQPVLDGHHFYGLGYRYNRDNLTMASAKSTNGKTRWAVDICLPSSKADSGFPWFIHEGHYLVVWQSEHVQCLDDRTGRVLWRRTLSWDYYRWIVATGQMMFVPARRHLSGIDIRTGKTLWENHYKKGHEQQLALGWKGKRLYLVMSDPGGIFEVLDPRTGKVLATARCPGAEFPGPMRNGTVILSGRTSYIFRPGDLPKQP